MKVSTGVSDGFPVKVGLPRVGVHQGSVLSPFIFAIVTDALCDDARERLLFEILYPDDLVLMAYTTAELWMKLDKWMKFN